MSDRLPADLAAAVGDRALITDPDRLASHEVDWTRRFRGTARAVVRPAGCDEVAAAVRVCAAAGVAVVPQGGNTGLVGGSVPRGGEVVISTLRMDDLEPVDEGAGEVTVGAGATLAAVAAHVRSAGWQVGMDLGARDSATVGGLVATNAGGVQVLRFGTMRQRVAGLEAVLGDGSVVRRMAGITKDNTGYDLGGLLAGSEGTLGVITRVRLRLVPPLPRRAVAVLGFGDAAAAVGAALRLRRTLGSLLALELFTDAGLDLVVRHAGLARPLRDPHPAYLLAEVGMGVGDAASELTSAVTELNADDGVLADDDAGRRRLWELRERHTEAIGAEGIVHKLDVSVPATRYAELVDSVGPAVAAVDPTARTIVYGHVADGNLHVNVLGPDADDHAVDDAVLELVLRIGGSISAEHGIGVAKVGWLERDRGAADVAAMRAIKRALDPHGIMNPGVILPQEER